jgi:hypothetical protein
MLPVWPSGQPVARAGEKLIKPLKAKASGQRRIWVEDFV